MIRVKKAPEPNRTDFRLAVPDLQMSFLILAYIALILIFLHPVEAGLREAFIKASLVFGVIITVSTELLSLANLVTYPVLLALYILLTLTGIVWAGLRRNIIKPALWRSIRKVCSLSATDQILLLIILLILAFTLVTALVSPPNMIDSLRYHMARVSAWIQNGNVSYYRTSLPRQNYLMPFAEFAILHLQLLSRSDRFANIVQWQSFAATAILATMIVREFGKSRSVQILAALLALSTPMAILQSSSAQNDLVTAALCMCFAFFLLKGLHNKSIETVVFAGISLGLAMLTKPTAYLYCFGLAVFLIPLSLFSKNGCGLIRVGRNVAVILAIALILNAGLYLRNYQIFQWPLASTAPEVYQNEVNSPETVVSNSIRNAALHLALPYHPWNQFVYVCASRLLGSRLNDPATTWDNEHFAVFSSLSESDAGNQAQFFLIVFAVAMLPFVKTERKASLVCFGGGIILGALLFCAVLKWQPWASRLHLPLFMIACPLVAVVLCAIPWRPYPGLIAAVTGLILFVFVAAIPHECRTLTYFSVTGLSFLLVLLSGKRAAAHMWWTAGGLVAIWGAYFLMNELKWAHVVLLLVIPLLIVLALLRSPWMDRICSLSLAMVLFSNAIIFVAFNQLRPLMPGRNPSVFSMDRMHQLFAIQPDDYEPYRQAVDRAIKECGNDLGLYLGNDFHEYLIWALAGRTSVRGLPRFHHLGVTGVWSKVGRDEPFPRIILAMRPVENGTIDGRKVIPIFESGLISVLKTQDDQGPQ